MKPVTLFSSLKSFTFRLWDEQRRKFVTCMARSVNNPWLHRFALLTAAATLALIGIGGLVTSHEAGMAVPDWPTSYGYNMFFFPLSQWWHAGNIFYEHSHRLFASGVGLLTTVLAVWLWLKESRGWVRWLGVLAFFAVVLQGVLGGLRVVLLKDELGIFHATLAQLFFVLTCAIALFTSRWWTRIERDGVGVQASGSPGNTLKRELQPAAVETRVSNSRRLFLFATVLILFQLILGAAMRHQHAGLAIPDFPLAYGKLWPAMDADSVARYNQQRDALISVKPITAFQIALQMTHRLVALLILAAVAFCAWKVRRPGFSRPEPPEGGTPNQRVLRRLTLGWLGLILIQAGLGAATVLSQKAADLATAHVLAGALSLATGALLCIIPFRSPELQRSGSLLSAAGLRARDERSWAAGTAA